MLEIEIQSFPLPANYLVTVYSAPGESTKLVFGVIEVSQHLCSRRNHG